MQDSLILTHEQLDEMVRHVDAHVPLEACGLLAGRGARVEAVLPIANAEPSPARFRMEPLEQLRAFEWMDERGLDLLGIFHSHPAGPGAVSPTDIAEATYEVVHVILFQREGRWQARGFWIADQQAAQVDLRVE